MNLSKAHYHEQVAAIELDGVPVTVVAFDTLLELIFVDERHNLDEDGISFVHGLWMVSLERSAKLLSSNRNIL